jgi:superfamily II DNA or RNA helicase
MSLKLRDYQLDGLQALRDGFAAGHRAQILYGPTGSGKTESAIGLLSAAATKQSRSAMVLDRIVLCNQTSQRLDKYSLDHGVLQAGHWRYRPHELIQVCSAQTLEKRGFFPGAKLLIIDECHTLRQATVDLIKNNHSIKVVGLTATPFTRGLGSLYTNVLETTTTKKLVEQGSLCPLRVFVCKEIDMTGAKKVAGEWSEAEASSRGIKITGDVVAEWVRKTHEIFGGPRKTIVFCSGVAHGADLAEKFGAAGYNFVPLSYKDDDQFKEEAIKEFSKPDSSIHGLIATDILTKGFDVSDTMIAVSARPFSKSLSSHIQQMGRVMRAHNGKTFGVWIDHSGNYLRFQDKWDEVYEHGPGELSDDLETARPEPKDEEKKESKCPKCGHLWGAEDMCPHCGFIRQRKNVVVATPGEVEELVIGGFKAKDGTFVSKQDFYSELLSYGLGKGFNEGWAAWKYKEKFGVFPRGLHKTPRITSLHTMNWLKSQWIRQAKGQAKGRQAA